MTKLSKRRYADIDQARNEYLARIDALVEAKRTIPAAKADAYRAKYEDACGIIAGSESSGWVACEASELGIGEKELAESIISARADWESRSARLEAKRAGAKNAVRQAPSARDMNIILESLRDSL